MNKNKQILENLINSHDDILKAFHLFKENELGTTGAHLIDGLIQHVFSVKKYFQELELNNEKI